MTKIKTASILEDEDKPAFAVRHSVVERLTAAITNGVFKPGDKLIERDLCERFEVSRPSIREALRQLESEQLVKIIPNRGPIVRAISLEELNELWDLRAAVESVAARRFAMHGTQEDFAGLETSIERLDEALKHRDQQAIRQRKNEFFECFARGSGNKVLPYVLKQLNARLSFLWTSSLSHPGRPEESISELKLLLSAVKSRNPEVATAAVTIYNAHAREVSLTSLRVFEEERAAATGKR